MVNVMDFVCALVTFSYSNWASKVQFLFHLFDFNLSGGISFDEMVILGGCWIRGIAFA
jgi:Ca2+-binding EF-hand superfamily protein